MLTLTNFSIKTENAVDIEEIIKGKNISVFFQSIISFNRKAVIGVEGLIRGINPRTGETIPPDELFEEASRQGLTLELDRICRDRVIEEFYKLYKKDKNKLLFLNLDASILDKVGGSNYLLNQIKKHKISPRNIVIEINETKVQDTIALKNFCDSYRRQGFMVALDDVGSGFSNMDRILLVKPDIIKMDIALVKNIQNDYYKQGIIRSLVYLANMVGALVLAEGVESREEAIEILNLRCTIMQGFFFAHPIEMYINEEAQVYEKIEFISKSFNRYMKNKIRKEKEKNRHLNIIGSGCVKELEGTSPEEFNSRLLEIIWPYKNIECAYILDETGVQVSNTVSFSSSEKVKDNLIFYSAREGTDHSMKEYYYLLASARISKYITEPYVSLATGNLCITFSKVFYGADGKKYILCIDFNDTEFDFKCEIKPEKDVNISSLMFNLDGKSAAEINRMINRMNEERIKDRLTNTYNRRYMEERLLVDIYNATNENQPISVILADIDFFKKVNDTYGHLAGDEVLKNFAKIAESNIRKNFDWIARYGGEEFLIVLLNASEKVAYEVAEKIRKAVESTPIVFQGNQIKITASFGTYTKYLKNVTYEELMEFADKNLYMAKNTGRNKTISQ